MVDMVEYRSPKVMIGYALLRYVCSGMLPSQWEDAANIVNNSGVIYTVGLSCFLIEIAVYLVRSGDA